jgi:hypothetical protein
MIIHDGKKLALEVNIGGISQSQLEKILGEHSQMILDSLGKKIGEMPKQTVIYNGSESIESKEEKEIKSNSLDKIADLMATVVKANESNFENKIGKIKKTKKDVSKEIDMLKNLE